MVAPEYRLAPEHPFPAAVDDSWAALNWAAKTYSLPLIVGGDSAGGNLSAVLALRARDQGAPKLAGQVLIYPVTDYDPERVSFRDESNQQILTAAGMLWFWDHYIAAPADRAHPDASPLRTKSVDNLPPTYLLIAEHDVLRDEGEAYGHRLAAAGNQITRDQFSGDTHGFLTLGAALPSAGRAVHRIGQWTRNILSGR